MIRIVNRRNYSGPAAYVGRGSPLGNPFSHVPSAIAKFKVATREEAIAKYREWIKEALMNDATVRNAFMTLVNFYAEFGEMTLACWCAPKRCHSEVIREMILEHCKKGGYENRQDCPYRED